MPEETPDPHTDAEGPVLGTTEAARRLGLSPRTVQRRVRDLVETGEIPVLHPLGTGRGTQYLIRERDLPKITDTH